MAEHIAAKSEVGPETEKAVKEAYEQMLHTPFLHVAEDSEIEVVNHPSHYTNGDIECIDAMKASMTPEEFKGYLKGNAFKYLWRYELKNNPMIDLEKCRWYLNALIEELSKEDEDKPKTLPDELLSDEY